MHRQGIWFSGLLVFSMVPLAIAGVGIQPRASARPALRISTLQSQMFQDLQNLEHEMSVDHTVHWKHSEPHGGEVITIPQAGAEGMLNTNGGRFGGYGLYLVKGAPVFSYVELTAERFRWGGPAALPPGRHTIASDFTYDGRGAGKGGTGVLSVDGKEVATKTIPSTIPFLISFDETFDVGVDTRTGVDDNDYQVPFRFTGKLDKLTIKPVPPNRTAAEQKLLQQHIQEARNAA